MLELSQLFEGTPTDIEGACVSKVKLKKRVAVLDGLGEATFLEEGRGTDEKGLLVCGILLKLLGTD